MKKISIILLLSLFVFNSCTDENPLAPGNDAPLKPFNPNPTQNAVDVPTNSSISWICSDPNGDTLYYNIYFGIDSLPPLIKRGYTDTTYNTLYLKSGTKYFWRITVADNHGAMDSSELWSFTTALPNNLPLQPSAPSPLNNAVNIDTTISFGWSCSDPDGDSLIYDIYLGESAQPQIAATNLSEKNYKPTNLKSGTKYFWNIVAKDSKGGSTAGTVWNFTTVAANKPPDIPSNPSPVDNATKVSLTTTLTWNCTDPDGDALTYDVYFGTATNPPKVKSATVFKTYTVIGITQETKYYWKITARDSKGNITNGPAWNFTTLKNGDPCPGTPTITYGGKTYNTVQIGTQCWTKENLDVGTMITSTTNATNNGTIEKYCYNNNTANCNTFGGLYQWAEAVQYQNGATNNTSPNPAFSGNVRGICPDGWHIPTYDEQIKLATEVKNSGKSLMSVGQLDGTNTSGFSGLLAGLRSEDGNFYDTNYQTFFWSTTEENKDGVLAIFIANGNNTLATNYYHLKFRGFSIRCVKD